MLNEKAYRNRIIKYNKIKQNEITNNLTNSIIAYIQYNRGAAWRVNTSGIPVIKNGKPVYGKNGKMRYRKSRNKGAADIRAIIKGQSVDIEIKSDDDELSIDQERFAAEVERAGGQYWTVRSFEEFEKIFKEWLQ